MDSSNKPFENGPRLSVYTWYAFSLIFINLNLNFGILSATSVYIERIFSKGQILLSHLHGHLSVQLTRALLCLGNWSKLGLIKAEDVQAVVLLAEEKDEECDREVEKGWDDVIDL